MMADPRLNSSAKLIAGIVNDQLWSEDHAAAFPSTKYLARVAGWDRVKDKGIARVRRALAALSRLGYLASMKLAVFWRWYRAIGGPKLGLKPPRASGNPRRFLVAKWKRPGAGPADWTAPTVNGEVVDRAHLPAGEMVNRAPSNEAPSTITKGAPSTITENGSKTERSKGTGDNHVTALAPGGSDAPPAPPPPTEGDVAGWLEDLKIPDRSPLAWKRTIALGGLDLAGRVPPEWLGKVPPRRDDSPPRPAAPPPQLSPQELLDNRIKRLAKGGPAAATDDVLDALAFDLSRSLLDAHSEATHRAMLAELATGKLQLDHFLIALRKGRAAPKGEGGRAFQTFIQPYRPRARRGRPPAGPVLPTHRRAAQGNPSH